MRSPLVALLPLFALAACGGSSDDPDATAASDPATTDPATSVTVAVDDDAGGGGGAAPAAGEGRWTMADQRYTPDVLACVVTVRDDGSIVEVVAQGALGDGSRYASLRLVDSPPAIGDASFQVEFPADGGFYTADLEPSGDTAGTVDDVAWDVVDDTFVLLGSFPVDGTPVSIDLETPCDVIDLAGGGDGSDAPADDGSTDDGSTDDGSTDGGSADDGASPPGPGDAVGTLVGPGVDIVVAGSCDFDLSDPASADLAFADVRGIAPDGVEWPVRFGLSGADSRNTQLNVNGSAIVVRWPATGEPAQTNDDGSYELDTTLGRLTAQAITEDGMYELDISCFER